MGAKNKRYVFFERPYKYKNRELEKLLDFEPKNLCVKTIKHLFRIFSLSDGKHTKLENLLCLGFVFTKGGQFVRKNF